MQSYRDCINEVTGWEALPVSRGEAGHSVGATIRPEARFAASIRSIEMAEGKTITSLNDSDAQKAMNKVSDEELDQEIKRLDNLSRDAQFRGK